MDRSCRSSGCRTSVGPARLFSSPLCSVLSVFSVVVLLLQQQQKGTTENTERTETRHQEASSKHHPGDAGQRVAVREPARPVTETPRSRRSPGLRETRQTRRAACSGQPSGSEDQAAGCRPRGIAGHRDHPLARPSRHPKGYRAGRRRHRPAGSGLRRARHGDGLDQHDPGRGRRVPPLRPAPRGRRVPVTAAGTQPIRQTRPRAAHHQGR